MTIFFKDSYTIEEASNLLSGSDSIRKKEIQRDLEKEYSRELEDLSLKLGHGQFAQSGRNFPPCDDWEALRQFTISRKEVLLYGKSKGIAFLEAKEVQKQIGPQPNYLFRRNDLGKGKITFDIIFNGKEFFGLKSMGLQYIYHCIRERPKKFFNGELYDEVRKGIPVEHKYSLQLEDQTLLGNQLKADSQMMRELKKEYNDLKIELREAEECHDPGRIDRAGKDLKDFNEKYAEYSYKGKAKVFGDTPQSKKSRGVKQEIYRAVREFSARKDAKELYDHLYNAFKPVHGPTKQYSPNQKVDWVIT